MLHVALWRGLQARTGGQPLASSQQGLEDLSPTAREELDPTSSHAVALEADSSLTDHLMRQQTQQTPWLQPCKRQPDSQLNTACEGPCLHLS